MAVEVLVLDAPGVGQRGHWADVRRAASHPSSDTEPAASRKTYAPPPVAPTTPGTLPDGLTQREAEILALIAQGLTNPEIAQQLCLSNHTVKSHINRIFTKTGSRDRAAAINYAHRHQLT